MVVQFRISFNPCYAGCLFERDNRYQYAQTDLIVSILVMLDVYLKVQKTMVLNTINYVSILVMLDVYLKAVGSSIPFIFKSILNKCCVLNPILQYVKDRVSCLLLQSFRNDNLFIFIPLVSNFGPGKINLCPVNTI